MDYASSAEKGNSPVATQLPEHNPKNKQPDDVPPVLQQSAQEEVVGGVVGVGVVENVSDFEKRKMASGHAHFHRLGWKRLTVVLIVEAIALGALSLPASFAALGMVPGVILCVSIGLVAVYTSYVVGQVKLKFPHCTSYADAGQIMMGRFGYELFGVMFALLLTFIVASHCLTGTIAFQTITQSGVCSLVFGVVSAILLFALAVPPSFAEVAILGYIDFASIVIAIGITIIGTGVQASNSAGGLSGVNWSAWPREGITFSEAFIGVSNIAFAYTFAMCQMSFMDEMHTPSDYTKSICSLGLIEIVIYTLTGALIYAFVGHDVQSPSLLSAGETLSRIVFGIALPVIFISGSINTTVLARYIHGRMFKNSIIRFINTTKGWLTWLGLLLAITVVAWIIAEAIPIFSDLLSIMSALFISAFTFYIPSTMWFMLIKEGNWYSKKNIGFALLNAAIFLIGMVLLVGGMYSTVTDIILNFSSGNVNRSFSCSQ